MLWKTIWSQLRFYLTIFLLSFCLLDYAMSAVSNGYRFWISGYPSTDTFKTKGDAIAAMKASSEMASHLSYSTTDIRLSGQQVDRYTIKPVPVIYGTWQYRPQKLYDELVSTEPAAVGIWKEDYIERWESNPHTEPGGISHMCNFPPPLPLGGLESVWGACFTTTQSRYVAIA